MKRPRKKIIFYTFTSASLVVLICFSIYVKSVLSYKQAVKNIAFEEINIADILDGAYTGECNVDAVSGATNSSKVLKKAVENALHK